MQPTLYTLAPFGQGTLSTMARPRAGDWLGDEIKGLRTAGVDVLVSLLALGEVTELDLTEEDAWCRAYDVRFISLPIADYGVPESELDILSLIETLRDLLARGQHIAVHCRQGIGRASLVAASVLVTLGHDAEDAFARIAEARGRPVPDTGEQREWVAAFATRLRLDDIGPTT